MLLVDFVLLFKSRFLDYMSLSFDFLEPLDIEFIQNSLVAIVG